MTTFGIFGTVQTVDGEFVHLEVSPGVVVQFAKGAIGPGMYRPGGRHMPERQFSSRPNAGDWLIGGFSVLVWLAGASVIVGLFVYRHTSTQNAHCVFANALDALGQGKHVSLKDRLICAIP